MQLGTRVVWPFIDRGVFVCSMPYTCCRVHSNGFLPYLRLVESWEENTTQQHEPLAISHRLRLSHTHSTYVCKQQRNSSTMNSISISDLVCAMDTPSNSDVAVNPNAVSSNEDFRTTPAVLANTNLMNISLAHTSLMNISITNPIAAIAVTRPLQLTNIPETLRNRIYTFVFNS